MRRVDLYVMFKQKDIDDSDTPASRFVERVINAFGEDIETHDYHPELGSYVFDGIDLDKVEPLIKEYRSEIEIIAADSETGEDIEI